ncbi:MAG: RsmE family RNA methyltransferase [Candidatus Saccharicenans sp.]|nr:RsmE family RNA methyltransferase [Candidatus Saccharicenans sp.]
MTSNQFFVRKLPPAAGRFFLEGEEHHHLARVARIKPGEKVWLTDGTGCRLLAEVETIEKDRTWLLPLEYREEKIKTRVVLGTGITKPATFDLIIQKATELGVMEIQPLLTVNSQPLPPERLERRIERWQRVAREALKQSKGAVLPEIFPPRSLSEVLKCPVSARKFYLTEDSPVYFRDILTGERPDRVCLMVGPEGGWAEEEKSMMNEAGFQGLSLGSRILRTETAVISALSLISHFWVW